MVARTGIPAASNPTRRLAPTRDPAGNRALLSEYHPGYGRRPAVRPVLGGFARPGHATIAGCRDCPGRPEQRRPRVGLSWLDRAARHASMNGVLNDGVRGASWCLQKEGRRRGFGGGLPTKFSKNNQTQCLCPVILA